MKTGKSLFLSTFVLVFLAELGDKTQIAAFSLSARNGHVLSVLIGASLALIVSTLLAVIVGHSLASRLPRNLMRIISGVLFLATGAFTLLRSLNVF